MKLTGLIFAIAATASMASIAFAPFFSRCRTETRHARLLEMQEAWAEQMDRESIARHGSC